MNYNFEWDSKKAKSNIAKHKVSFENASFVFKDKNAISIYDKEHKTSCKTHQIGYMSYSALICKNQS